MPERLHVPEPPPGRKLGSRESLLVVCLAVLALLLFEGRSIRHSGEQMRHGWERSLVLAVGHPAGWLAERLGSADLKDDLTGWLSAEDELDGPPTGATELFDPSELRELELRDRPLRTLLVTGDSLAQPLDAEIARSLARAARGVRTVRDARLGTGISQTELVNWRILSRQQAASHHPDATVIAIGANEGFPIGGVECCGSLWVAEYGRRARRVMTALARGGRGRVYWLNLPAPRDPDRQEISNAVNRAIRSAAEGLGKVVKVVDVRATFTPGGRYRDSMEVDGQRRLVREPDGIHLNGTGAEIAAARVLAAVRRDFPSLPR